MNRLFRLAFLLLRARWASRCPPLGPCITPMRVWPNDLDVFLHMNNGVYLTLCDLARVDLLLRSGSMGISAGPRRPFLVAAETIQIRRPLRLFQRFRIATRVLGWDDRAFFLEQRFLIDGSAGTDVAALAVVEGRVTDHRRGRMAPAAIAAELGVDPASPPLPAWVERWKDDQRVLRQNPNMETS